MGFEPTCIIYVFLCFLTDVCRWGVPRKNIIIPGPSLINLETKTHTLRLARVVNSAPLPFGYIPKVTDLGWSIYLINPSLQPRGRASHLIFFFDFSCQSAFGFSPRDWGESQISFIHPVFPFALPTIRSAAQGATIGGLMVGKFVSMTRLINQPVKKTPLLGGHGSAFLYVF